MTQAAQSEVLAPKVRDLFFDGDGNWVPSFYKVMHGGRGGLKSWGFARVAVLLALKRRVRIACAREYQKSIEESVHQTIVAQIDALNLRPYFDIRKRAITAYNGSRFFFAGIKTDPGKFKSTEGIDVLWIEEGEKVTEESWQIVEPTIRKAGSEIWCSFNPDLETDPTSKRFIGDPVPGARVLETNWRDNPWLSDRLVSLKDYLARVDPDAYAHVWEGKFRRNSAAQILRGKVSVEAFTPVTVSTDERKAWHGPYFGLDFGFSQDPTAAVKVWIHERTLYVEYEVWQVGCDIDATPALLDQIPGANLVTMRADSARPETISYLQRHGYGRVVATGKWPGSVEDGIAHLRSYERIVIHPRCERTIEETRLYSYRVDKLTSQVMTDVVDKHNHCIDAIRYALNPLIQNNKTGMLAFIEQEAAARQEKP